MAGRTRGAAPTRCPSCGQPVLTHCVGHTAALRVSVDLLPPDTRRPYQPALAASTPDDLVWCLPRLPHRAPRLRWTYSWHPPNCPHQHLLAHHCTTEPTTLF